MFQRPALGHEGSVEGVMTEVGELVGSDGPADAVELLAPADIAEIGPRDERAAKVNAMGVIVSVAECCAVEVRVFKICVTKISAEQCRPVKIHAVHVGAGK